MPDEDSQAKLYLFAVDYLKTDMNNMRFLIFQRQVTKADIILTTGNAVNTSESGHLHIHFLMVKDFTTTVIWKIS